MSFDPEHKLIPAFVADKINQENADRRQCLRLPTKGNGSPKKWREVTPMMAAGVTDHVWTLRELLTYRVPPSASKNIVSIDKGH